ncbi:ribosomal protein uS13 [Candidatus Nesciobacter abundans]|uniref:ribosomal protein uS13 n=1 Tax=Candidatus Nesciobacter abundans TaxID=2601668 RepID=UPI001CA3B2AF|nr:30S ribosomal protein S13 [Candidatus Nesciobacter abundans]
MRIAGESLKENKAIECALTYVYGIGKYTAFVICEELGILGKKVKELGDKHMVQIQSLIEELDIPIGSELQKRKRNAIMRLVNMRCYRGIRLQKGLPVRGQRTHSNAKTASRVRGY